MNSEPTRVTLCVELEEELYHCMQDFLADNSDWNRKQIIDVSLTGFLRENNHKSQPEDYQDLVQEIYLQSVS